ncbi:MAG: glutamate carboxypeptidase [Mariniblastus sp.]|jgi:glutamate carboxypeptidase
MNHLLDHLTLLDNQQDSMLHLVRELCDVNSGTFNLDGLETVKSMLIENFAELGGEIQVLDCHPLSMVDEGGKEVQQELGQMIHITKWPDAPQRILLCIHMDTVYGVDHPFQKCQSREDGNLNGPGVADAKGGLVVMLNALKTLEASPLAGKIGWEVLINPDEEIGSPGSVQVINEIAGRCDLGLLFEPSLPDGTLVSWRKGSGNFTFVVRGRAAHAGREFEKGRNAIAALARLLDCIDQLNTDPEVTYNIGRVRGGDALNVVPDLAIGRVNVRVKTVEQQAEVENKFSDLVATFNRLDGIDVKQDGYFSSPPKPLSENVAALQQRIEQCGQALSIPVSWRGTGGACDGNKFAAAGLPNIDTLGPRGGNIHSSDEYLIPESLVPRAKLTALILLSYANAH